MRLYNASVSDLAPLRYPDGIPNDGLLPETRRHLTTFTGKLPYQRLVNVVANISLFSANQLQAASQALRLPALHVIALVENRKRQIADYIGVPF
jgi:hypothetical protein